MAGGRTAAGLVAWLFACTASASPSDQQSTNAAVSPPLVQRAIAAGANPETVRAVFSHEYDNPPAKQSPDDPVAYGKAIARENYSFLRSVEYEYLVDVHVLIGIFGVETLFGNNTGDTAMPVALTTLYNRGRQKLAISELVSIAKLIDEEKIEIDELFGSHAGALGLTQFLPSSVINFAVDGNKDGKIDLWQVEDALASTANYLAKHGWTYGQPAALQVELAEIISDEGAHSAVYWNSRGVRLMSGGLVPSVGKSHMRYHDGRAYLIYDNFDVLLRYNQSSEYVFSVVDMANDVGGHYEVRVVKEGNVHRDPILVPYYPIWNEIKDAQFTRVAGAEIPIATINKEDEEPAEPVDVVVINGLLRSEVMEIQRSLSANGYSITSVDGLFGPETRRAIALYQLHQNKIMDGKPTKQLLQQLRGG